MASDKAQKTRAALLDAARTLVIEAGIGALSLDRVCQLSGISKGALTYHFPNKQALLVALSALYAAHLEDELEVHLARSQGQLLPAYCAWFRHFGRDSADWSVFGMNFVGRYFADDTVMAPVRSWYKALYARIDTAPEAERTALYVAVMAMEGLFWTHKMGLDLADAALREAALERIAALTVSA